MSQQTTNAALAENLFDPEILYSLLPALYLERDQAQRESLRALLAVLTQEFSAIARDVQHLYDNWFIETCDEWVVPYIAELVGVRGLIDETHLAYSQRARIANTLRYRQRKGTPATLEQAAKDCTGWPACVVEGYTQLAVTQSVNHLRPRQRLISVSDQDALDELGTPFSAIGHGIDIRSRSATPMTTTTRLTQGGYSLHGLTLFLWRLQSYPMICGTPAANDAGEYMFHPLGVSTPLFNIPLTTTRDRVGERNVPTPLRRRPLRDAIDGLLQGHTSATGYFNDQPVFQLWVRSTTAATTEHSTERADIQDFQAIPPTAMRIADLSDDRPTVFPAGVRAIVDPVAGRFVLSPDERPTEIRVNYAYGFSADLGGGPYDRQSNLAVPESSLWQAIVAQDAVVPQTQPSGSPQVFTSLDSAVQAWVSSGKNGLIQIADSGTYGSPSTEYAITPNDTRSLVIQSMNGTCPCVVGHWRIVGSQGGTSVTLNGLWLDGPLTVQGNLQLNLQHCTLKPPSRNSDLASQHASIQSDGSNNVGLQVAITRCITGPIRLLPEMAGLWVQDSIIDGGKGIAIADPLHRSYSTPAVLKRTTVFGQVWLSSLLLASDVLFVDPVYVQHRQVGALRFCYLPLNSQPPRCYHCQPELAAHGQPAAVQATIATQLKPTFTAMTYGHPGYAQLSLNCPLEIRSGGTQGAEIGAFHHLYQFQREVHLSEMLGEYMPCNLTAGVVYVT